MESNVIRFKRPDGSNTLLVDVVSKGVLIEDKSGKQTLTVYPEFGAEISTSNPEKIRKTLAILERAGKPTSEQKNF